MNKIIVTIVIAAVVIVGGYFLLKNPRYSTPSSDISPQPSPQETSEVLPPVPATEQAPVTQENPPANQNVITYTDAGYSPSTLRVKVGATATFKNDSSRSMWTASAVHPTHRSYPTAGGCIGSTFDACTGTQPGTSWSFKFNIAGAWKYHNHLNPGDTGTIIVE